MKALITLTITFTSLTLLADTSDSKVNYHLRSLQTVMDSNASKARVESLKVDESQFETQEAYLRNHPGFGIGDEGASAVQDNRYQNEDQKPTTAEESIRMELEQRRITSFETPAPAPTNENAEFIREFKAKAASKGVHLEVDPVTLEVRKVR